MGLSLGGLACVRRESWVWAGVLFGLAVTSQQFALLVLAPLFVLAPPSRRMRFAGGAIGPIVLVVVPLVVLTSGHVIRAAVLGSGNTASVGGTVLWEMHLQGAPLVAASRILPIVVSIVLAWCARRRFGELVLEPVPLLSLVATSLSLRLIFEQNLFGYYFMALAVSLVVLDVVRGRIRSYLLAWLALVTLAFNPVPVGVASRVLPWSIQLRDLLPASIFALAVWLVLRDVLRDRYQRYLAILLVSVVLTVVKVPGIRALFSDEFPTWFWQIVLVTVGAALAVTPLLSFARDRAKSIANAR
jgi:hypothetical protein